MSSRTEVRSARVCENDGSVLVFWSDPEWKFVCRVMNSSCKLLKFSIFSIRCILTVLPQYPNPFTTIVVWWWTHNCGEEAQPTAIFKAKYSRARGIYTSGKFLLHNCISLLCHLRLQVTFITPNSQVPRIPIVDIAGQSDPGKYAVSPDRLCTCETTVTNEKEFPAFRGVCILHRVY